ncbi:MAG: hypothetical protein A2W28_08400 [Gammaproteobacteria bacterium RBG_16_51_14]|nr:MAG: hypothetical protein A2W28_08400 [Gammaproteobacteria bacterium RBG_16_51_14]
MSIAVEISLGEFLDKLTILEIKSERINDQEKLININTELSRLREIWSCSPYTDTTIDNELDALRGINTRLWEIEDEIREKEARQEFDSRFVELARSVYFSNDKRAEIKRALNIKLGSALHEEKSYSDYSNAS